MLINTKESIQAMNTLEYWNDLGLIQLIRTDTMEIEFQKVRNETRRTTFITKAQKFKEDYGVQIVDHSQYNKYLGGPKVRPSILDELSSMLFQNISSQDKDLEQRRIRDIAHLNTHYMNDRDLFVTRDHHFHDKKDVMDERFGIKIVCPEECLSIIEQYWRKDRSDNVRIRNPNNPNASILMGNHVSHHLMVGTREETFLEIENVQNKYFVIIGNLHNQKGAHAVEINPEEIKVKTPSCRVSVSYFHENDIGILMPLKGNLYSELYIHDSAELLLKAEVFKNGDLFLYSKIYNKFGELLVSITKDTMQQHQADCVSSWYQEQNGDGTATVHLLISGQHASPTSIPSHG